MNSRSHIANSPVAKKLPTTSSFFKPTLVVNEPGDVFEREADAVANRIMRMTNHNSIQAKFFKPVTVVQRQCTDCEEEDKKMQRKETSNGSIATTHAFESYVGNLDHRGQSLSNEVRDFYEPRFGCDFSNVKVHTDTVAAKSAKSINARAYTSGNNIVFDSDQYTPATDSGKRLLAHELTHVVQQSSLQGPAIQRATYNGTDWAGRYVFDDNACTLNYSQDWYFQFPTSIAAGQQTSYMAAAESQVESVWSHKHRLIPSGTTCACSPNGVDVSVDLLTHNEERRGRHGYGVNVITDPTTGLTTLPTRTMTLHESHDTAVNMGDGLTQQRIAHEFGHTLNMNDEYTGWANFWGIPGAGDRSSIMHSGDEVRPRHYQPFADMISTVLEGCLYRPQGLASSTLVNPVARFGMTGALTLDNAQFVLDLSVDRRLGNSDILGLFTPRLGFNAQFNAANGNVMFGPTLGFSLNRFQHPIYVDVRTGVLFDPADPGRPASLNIPASVTAGFRGDGFTAGINYTGMIDVLGNTGYTHMLGVNLQFDLPGGRR